MITIHLRRLQPDGTGRHAAGDVFINVDKIVSLAPIDATPCKASHSPGTRITLDRGEEVVWESPQGVRQLIYDATRPQS